MAKHRALALLVFMTGVAHAGIYSYKAPDGTIVFTDEPAKGAKQVKIEKPVTVPALRLNAVPKAKQPVSTQPMWPEPAATTMPKISVGSASEEAPAYGSSSNTSWSSDTQGITAAPKRVKKKASVPAVIKAKKPVVKVAAKPVVKKVVKKPAATYSKLRIVTPSPDSTQWLGGELTVQLAVSPPLQKKHVVSLRYDGREVYVGSDLQIVVPGVARGAHTLQATILHDDTGKQILVGERTYFQIHRPSIIRKPQVRKQNISE